MKTNQLIAALVEDRVRPASAMGSSLRRAIAASGLVSLAIFAVAFGPRLDLAAAFATWRFDLKLVLVLTAFVAALGACVALTRPIMPASLHWRLLPVAALATAAVAIELCVIPRAAWETRLIGTNALVCLTAIPLFAAAPLAALLGTLRRTAPASPALTGAAAGVLAATAAAMIYAFHCFDDSPLFVLTWYPLAATPVIIVGAAAGHRLLRW